MESVYTIDDIYALPDGERAELIDGQIYYMAMPNTKHQRLLGDLIYKIGSYICSHNENCEVYLAPFAVFLDQDDYNYVEPDISVICDLSKLDERGCNGAPDWIIEITSESSKRMDYTIKPFKYRSAGVREYWIVDQMKQRVIVYHFEHDTMDKYTFADEIPVEIFEGFTIKIE